VIYLWWAGRSDRSGRLGDSSHRGVWHWPSSPPAFPYLGDLWWLTGGGGGARGCSPTEFTSGLLDLYFVSVCLYASLGEWCSSRVSRPRKGSFTIACRCWGVRWGQGWWCCKLRLVTWLVPNWGLDFTYHPVARSVWSPGGKGGLSGVTVRWLEVPPSCKSHCLRSLMLGCVYLHARYLIVLKLVCVGPLLCPSIRGHGKSACVPHLCVVWLLPVLLRNW